MREQIYSVGDLRAIIAPIAARHGVERIYLFGSYARGEATKNSDVDLRVDKGNLRGMFALARSTAISKTALEKIWIC